MASSINSYLTVLASNYFISYESNEREQIKISINTLKSRLETHFGSKVKDVLIFGSWKRDTTLPRTYDVNSDIDIMIIFDHENLNRSAETYRNWVMEFAKLKYSTSISKKDFPTVRLDMTHITLDLIPTKHTSFFNIINQYEIPDIGNNWMTTDPFSFNKKVRNKNRDNNSIVKPVLRLIKAWNANSGYPFASYELEKYIVDNMFWFFNSSVESAFFSATNNLPEWSATQKQKNKVKILKNNIGKVKAFLKEDNVIFAKYWLHKILPN